MSLIAFRRAGEEPPPEPPEPLEPPEPPEPPVNPRSRLGQGLGAPPATPDPGADPGAAARSFYESVTGSGGAAGSPGEPPGGAEPGSPRFCRTCGSRYRDPPEQHRRSTAHLLGLGAPPLPPGTPEPPGRARYGPGYRLLLRAGWLGGGLGPGGRGRLLPVPTELRRDRAGLGWDRGTGPGKRVTHFGPGDAAAVGAPAPGGAGGEGSRCRCRSRCRCQSRFGSEAAERAWEIRLREYMERWDPPENPVRARRDPP